jgi:hypothetical protein
MRMVPMRPAIARRKRRLPSVEPEDEANESVGGGVVRGRGVPVIAWTSPPVLAKMQS